METQIGAWLARMAREHRVLLRELTCILVAALVTGLFFLENMDARFQEHRKNLHMALATQVASGAADFVAAGNRVSLTVLASQAAALEPVARTEIRNTEGRVLASGGKDSQGLAHPLERPVRTADGELVGTVALWPVQDQALRQRFEALFVLVVFCLLGLRLAGTIIWRRLEINGQEPSGEAENKPAHSVMNAVRSPVQLRIAVLNQDFLDARYTPSLMNEVLADYRQLLERVSEVYGGQLIHPLGKRGRINFADVPSRADTAFKALCAAQLFLQASRKLGEERKAAGQPVLEFKLLLTVREDEDFGWACCQAGRPGRVNVPENELLELELDTRALYRADHGLSATCDGVDVRLQPIEQLAQRYQTLIAGQVARVVTAA